MQSCKAPLWIVLSCALALMVGCAPGQDGSESAEGCDPAPTEIVATTANESISWAELEAEAFADLKRLEQQRYNMLRETLVRMTGEREVDRLADERGLSREALLRVEVEEQVTGPTEEELAAFYEKNKQRARGQSFEELHDVIYTQLRTPMVEERQREFVAELRAKADLRMLIEPPRTTIRVPVDAPSRGPQEAPITIVEYADFECKFCRRAYATIERVLNQYNEEVRFVFRDFPVRSHRRAVPSSIAARCAGEQGKYWEYFQNLMVMGGDLSDEDLLKRATDTGLDDQLFSECVNSDRYTESVQSGFEEGGQFGVSGTPTFFINGRRLEGARTYEDFRTIIEEELTRLRPETPDSAAG